MKFINLPKGECDALIAASMQVSKRPAWNDYDCPCGWTQRTQFARRMDPQSMFIDDDDEDAEELAEALTILGDSDTTRHTIQDGQRVNKKRAKEDEAEELTPEGRRIKRQRQNRVTRAD